LRIMSNKPNCPFILDEAKEDKDDGLRDTSDDEKNNSDESGDDEETVSSSSSENPPLKRKYAAIMRLVDDEAEEDNPTPPEYETTFAMVTPDKAGLEFNRVVGLTSKDSTDHAYKSVPPIHHVTGTNMLGSVEGKVTMAPLRKKHQQAPTTHQNGCNSVVSELLPHNQDAAKTAIGTFSAQMPEDNIVYLQDAKGKPISVAMGEKVIVTFVSNTSSADMPLRMCLPTQNFWELLRDVFKYHRSNPPTWNVQMIVKGFEHMSELDRFQSTWWHYIIKHESARKCALHLEEVANISRYVMSKSEHVLSLVVCESTKILADVNHLQVSSPMINRNFETSAAKNKSTASKAYGLKAAPPSLTLKKDSVAKTKIPINSTANVNELAEYAFRRLLKDPKKLAYIQRLEGSNDSINKLVKMPKNLHVRSQEVGGHNEGVMFYERLSGGIVIFCARYIGGMQFLLHAVKGCNEGTPPFDKLELTGVPVAERPNSDRALLHRTRTGEFERHGLIMWRKNGTTAKDLKQICEKLVRFCNTYQFGQRKGGQKSYLVRVTQNITKYRVAKDPDATHQPKRKLGDLVKAWEAVSFLKAKMPGVFNDTLWKTRPEVLGRFFPLPFHHSMVHEFGVPRELCSEEDRAADTDEFNFDFSSDEE